MNRCLSFTLLCVCVFSFVFVLGACSDGGGGKKVPPPHPPLPPISAKYIAFSDNNAIFPTDWQQSIESDGTHIIYLTPMTEYTFKAGVFLENDEITDEYLDNDFTWAVMSAVMTAIISSQTGKSIVLKTGANGYGTIRVAVANVGIFDFKVKDKVFYQ